MKNKNANRGAGFSLAKTLLIAAAAILASFTASAQTNMNLSNVNPYFSISNSFTVGAGTILANDPITGAVTFDYTKGTNNTPGQAQVNPVGVTRARYVSFGFQVATTNSAGSVAYSAIIQGSTGYGDWLSLTPSLVVTPTAASNSAGIYVTASTNATYDTGGLILFRLKSIQSAELGNTNAIGTVSFSSKPGI